MDFSSIPESHRTKSRPQPTTAMNTLSETAEGTRCHCPVCNTLLPSRPNSPPFDAPCPHCGCLLWCCKKMVEGVIVLGVIPGITPDPPDITCVSDKLVGDGGIPRVIVDLSDVERISSAFAARLLSLSKRIRSAQGRFILCGLNRPVRETLHGCRLDRMFEIADDQATALVSFQ